MTQDLNSSNPENSESQEPSPELSTPQPSVEATQARRQLTVDDLRATHAMLVGFREALKDGSFVCAGKHLRHVAMGIEFIDNMVNKSASDLEIVKRQEKEMRKRATDAIKEAGGKIIQENGNASTQAPSPTPNA